MASRSNLGRIRPYPKGAYSAAVEYVYFDMVTNDGSTYLYINTTASTGTAITDTAYWQCLAQKGDTGAQGIPGNDGTNGTNGIDGISRIFIRYSATANPTDADISTTPNEYIGIYTAADAAETAPTTASSYTWYKIKGEGSAATITIGTVTTGTPAVNNSGTSEAAVLNFVIPNPSDTLTVPTIAAQDLGEVSGTVSLNTDLYSMFKMKPIDDFSIEFAGSNPSTGRGREITLLFDYDAANTVRRNITWPTNVKWSCDDEFGNYDTFITPYILRFFKLGNTTDWLGFVIW